MGQGSNDGVLEFLSADRKRLTFRLGLEFRDPKKSPPDDLLPARYVRVQVASPPPRRIDGTTWAEGLTVGSGAGFDPGNPPADGKVIPIGGIAPLGQPDPKTIVLDRWLVACAVKETAATETGVTDSDASPPTFIFGPTNPEDGPLSFLSVPYPDPSIDGTRLSEAGVNYYKEGDIAFDRDVNNDVDGIWIAVSVDRFFPPERASADYIVCVTPEG